MDIRRAYFRIGFIVDLDSDAGIFPNNKQIPLDLPVSILLDWNTHILVDSKQPSIRERLKT